MHGWPIEHIGAKTFPYGTNKTVPTTSVHLSRTQIPVVKKRKRHVRVHYNGKRNSSIRPQSSGIQTSGTTTTEEEGE